MDARTGRTFVAESWISAPNLRGGIVPCPPRPARGTEEGMHATSSARRLDERPFAVDRLVPPPRAAGSLAVVWTRRYGHQSQRSAAVPRIAVCVQRPSYCRLAR